MALRSRTRNRPEMLPYFHVASLCSAFVSGWQVLTGLLGSDVQGVSLALGWVLYWLVCCAMLFAIMATWDCWIMPAATRRARAPICVTPQAMGLIALTIGACLPLFGLAL